MLLLRLYIVYPSSLPLINPCSFWTPLEKLTGGNPVRLTYFILFSEISLSFLLLPLSLSPSYIFNFLSSFFSFHVPLASLGTPPLKLTGGNPMGLSYFFGYGILLVNPPLPSSSSPSSSPSSEVLYPYSFYFVPIPSFSSCAPPQKLAGDSPMVLTNVLFSTEILLSATPSSALAPSSSLYHDIPSPYPFSFFPCTSLTSFFPPEKSTVGYPMGLIDFLFCSGLLLATPLH